MTTIVSIDPGLRNLGIAVHVDGVLYRAALIRNPEKKARDGAAWCAMANETHAWLYKYPSSSPLYGLDPPSVLIAEIPQIYRFGKSKGDPDDLIQLAGVVGAVASVVGAKEFVAYRPREWKGTVSGDVFTARAEAALTEKERACIEPCPASLRHNLIDALKIGEYFWSKRSK